LSAEQEVARVRVTEAEARAEAAHRTHQETFAAELAQVRSAEAEAVAAGQRERARADDIEQRFERNQATRIEQERERELARDAHLKQLTDHIGSLIGAAREQEERSNAQRGEMHEAQLRLRSELDAEVERSRALLAAIDALRQQHALFSDRLQSQTRAVEQASALEASRLGLLLEQQLAATAAVARQLAEARQVVAALGRTWSGRLLLLLSGGAPALSDMPRADLKTLLTLDGAAFVRAAYRAVLGREADPPGEASYVAQLRDGRSKVVLLADMARSPEGQQNGAVVAGLRRAVFVRRLSRLIHGRERPTRAQNLLAPVAAAGASIASAGDGSFSSATEARLHSVTPTFQHFRETVLIKDVLTLHDADFVRAAYRLVLKREVDPSGEQTYVSLLRAGYDRCRLLGDLATSEEGRALGPVDPDVRRMLRRARLSWLPIIGRPLAGLLSSFRPRPQPDPDAAFRHQIVGTQHATLDMLNQVLSLTRDLQHRQVGIERALARMGSRQSDARRFRG
jgi:hypothetical protein